MNPWNLLLESLHSSLIDELIERSPNPRPVLGLPRKENGLLWPDPALPQLLAVDVKLTPVDSACILMGVDGAAQGRIGTELEALWERMVARGKKHEFERRKLAPGFSNARRINAKANDTYPLLRKMIWIPFGLQPGTLYLGLGL